MVRCRKIRERHARKGYPGDALPEKVECQSENSGFCNLPYIGDTKKACAIFKKNLVEITWNCISSLENNPTTLPQTASILEGQSVGGISIFDLMQVKNYGDGCKNLIWQLFNNEFSLSINLLVSYILLLQRKMLLNGE